VCFSELLAGPSPTFRGIRRVRFTHLIPSDFDKDIVAAIESQPKIMRPCAFAGQSGSTKVLRAMQRTYRAKSIWEKIAMMRGAAGRSPSPPTSYVGFRKTESDFEQTLSLLDESTVRQFVFLQVSPRPNTPSPSRRRMRFQTEEKGRRLAVLQDKQREIQSESKKRWLERRLRCWAAEIAARETSGLGYSNVAPRAKFTSQAQELLGTYVHVHVTGAGRTIWWASRFFRSGRPHGKWR